jgi:predicted alpha/beta superfamily hydrolase
MADPHEVSPLSAPSPSMAPRPAGRARLSVRYPHRFGAVQLRGNTAPLSWTRGVPPSRSRGDVHEFDVVVPAGTTVEVKVVRGDGAWAAGRNVVLAEDDEMHVAPSFDHHAGRVTAPRTLTVPGGQSLSFRVYLPPSYDEQDEARYAVIYAQDGQALFSDGTDPFGLWKLENVLDGLIDLGSMAEVIVVAIETSAERIARLSPVKDRRHGGGGASAHLDALVEHLKPLVDREYRTLVERQSTALLGSSMGGLFSFYAVWTRPDIFGKAMCLSSSFWWADRWMIRHVQDGGCPAPRPLLYLDSGASLSQFADDADERDGIHHTQAMSRALVTHCFERGDNLHVLSFAGLRHDAASWAARVAVPLQLMFYRKC